MQWKAKHKKLIHKNNIAQGKIKTMKKKQKKRRKFIQN